MSNVILIHPGAEPSNTTASGGESHINIVEQHLAQARAIVDLVMMADHETLFDDTIANALWSVLDRIEDARGAADVLNREAREKARP